MIFLLFLQEAYLGVRYNDSVQYMDNCLTLISANDEERILHRGLFSDGSKLLKHKLLAYDSEMNNNSFEKMFFIPNELLEEIIFTHNDSLEAQNIAQNYDGLFDYIEPTVSLDDVVLSDVAHSTFETLVNHLNNDVMDRLIAWGIQKPKSTVSAKIILYGASGTGKTMSALALANALGKPVLSLDCSKVLSKWIGDSEKNVRKIFDTFKAIREKDTKTVS